MDKISIALEAARSRLPEMEIRLDEPMKNHTSYKIGGPVRAMFFPSSTATLLELAGLFQEYEVTPLIIGNGTNLLADDAPLDMVAVKTTGLNNIRRTGERELTADAGVSLSRLAVFACNSALSGLEFAHGIPGTLGGAVAMNAGAYGGEMKDVVQSTKICDPIKGVHTIKGEEHCFSYRSSRFRVAGEVILSSVIRLLKGDKDSIRMLMEELNLMRSGSQPLDVPSAGSTFKRPATGFAAAMIEQAGLKGFAIGGASVSQKHSGFVINNGGATFSDVMAVITHIKETVFKQFNIELEPEIKIISRNL